MTRLQVPLPVVHRHQVAPSPHRRPAYATSGFDLTDGTESLSDITDPPNSDYDVINKLYGAGRKPTTVALSFRRQSESSDKTNGRCRRRRWHHLPKLILPSTGNSNGEQVNGSDSGPVDLTPSSFSVLVNRNHVIGESVSAPAVDMPEVSTGSRCVQCRHGDFAVGDLLS